MNLSNLGILAAALALLPFLVALANLPFYRRPRGPVDRAALVSILIPARNEAANITAAVQAALATGDPRLEVLVLDDHSEDDTAARVRAIAAYDDRVRLLQAGPLPPGWTGKAHACWQLAAAARGDSWVFVDADVRLAPGAARRLHEHLRASGLELASGVPRQICGTLAERLVVPLIDFMLLGYLPLAAARLSGHPAFAAACGQLVAVRAAGYRAAGGHAAVRAAWHDGLALARRFRARGLATGIVDARPLADCRMYRGCAEVWQGFAKNAHEGLGTAGAILPWTLLLGGGQVLPVLLLASGVATANPALVAVGACAWLARLTIGLRCGHQALDMALHPFGVALLLTIQWWAFLRRRAGWRPRWKGRTQDEH